MSKVQFTKLDDLLAHAKITDNKLIENVVNNFIEETTICMVEANDWGWSDVPDGRAIKEECIENTDTDLLDSPTAVRLVGVASRRDQTLEMLKDADIWLRVDYTVIAYWTEGFEEQDWEIHFDAIKVYWMRNEFDLMNSTALKSRLTTNILLWL